MATGLSHFPVKKTTTDAGPVTGPCQLGGMVYIATGAGSAILQDEAGNDLINLNTTAAGTFSYNLPKLANIAGYKLSTLSNGTAYIYLY